MPVATGTRRLSWERLLRLRKRRRVQTVVTLGLVILGPVLALLTFLAMGPLDQGSASQGCAWCCWRILSMSS